MYIGRTERGRVGNIGRRREREKHVEQKSERPRQCEGEREREELEREREREGSERKMGETIIYRAYVEKCGRRTRKNTQNQAT